MAQNIFQTPRRLNENNSNAVFLNGKSVQHNDLGKKKMAFGDIKNHVPLTPSIAVDKKATTNTLNVNQLKLFKDVDVPSAMQTQPTGFCASKAVDYEKVWAEKFILSDADVNYILSRQFYDDSDTLRPPPPSPQNMDVYMPPDYFPDLLNLLESPPPLPLDLDDQLLADPTAYDESHHDDNDESPLNRSIFEFSDSDLTFDDLSNNFAGRMHF